MSARNYNVLFLCTGNSARSILAEAALNKLGNTKFHAYSAGSRPIGRVNPLALAVLQEHQFDTSTLRSKSWEEFAPASAPMMDFVFTVCDNAAGETCPLWPGQPIKAHWGYPDPAAVAGSVEQQRTAFTSTLHALTERIHQFIALPIEELDRAALQRAVRELGEA